MRGASVLTCVSAAVSECAYGCAIPAISYLPSAVFFVKVPAECFANAVSLDLGYAGMVARRPGRLVVGRRNLVLGHRIVRRSRLGLTLRRLRRVLVPANP